jgi:transcriptional regulator with XRE-family HTH domain
MQIQQGVLWETVRRLMTERGMNQSALARAIGRSDAEVSRWLSGDRCPRLDVVCRMLGALGCNLGDLVDYPTTAGVVVPSGGQTPSTPVLTADEATLVAGYRRLNKRDRRVVRTLVAALGD